MGAVNLRDGLVAEYLMRGNLDDSSENDNTGSITGTVVLISDKDGRLNSAYDFEGSTDYVTTGINPNTFAQLSIVCWVNIDASNDYSGICISRAGAGLVGLDLNNTGKSAAYFGTGGTDYHVLSTTTIESGGWLHLALTMDGSELKIYVNGVVEDTDSAGSGTCDIDDVFKIGVDDTNVSSRSINGTIGPLSIWNRGLSQEEITQLYNEIKPWYQPIFVDCLAYYDFKGDANDLIGTQDGTVTAATLTSGHLGLANSAYTFNGSSAYITLDGLTSASTDYTFSYWIKPGTDATAQYLFDSVTGRLVIAQKETGSLSGNMGIYDGTSWRDLGASPTDDVWTHVVITLDVGNSEAKVYINGALRTTAVYGSTTIGGATTRIGTNNNTTANPLTADLGDFIIWTRLLPVGEIKALYDLTKNKYITPFDQGGKK